MYSLFKGFSMRIADVKDWFSFAGTWSKFKLLAGREIKLYFCAIFPRLNTRELRKKSR